MRMPSLRLPAIGTDLFEDFPTRKVLLYGAYTLVLFLVFLVLNFPYRVIVTRLLNDVDLENVQIDVHDASLAVWHGLELRGVLDLEAAEGEVVLPPAQVEVDIQAHAQLVGRDVEGGCGHAGLGAAGLLMAV